MYYLFNNNTKVYITINYLIKMYENVIYNRNMFYRDKLYDYKKFCERIALIKSNCTPKSPPVYSFLKNRLKKKEMENEKKKEIEICQELLYQKYKYMYKNHNKYHPSNLRFQPHPPSLKLSQCTPRYYEIAKDNKYLGNKIKEVQKSKGKYNCSKSLSDYKKLKYIRDERIKSSKYNKNILLNLVTPLTYEKRLMSAIHGKNIGNKNIKNKFGNSKNIFLRMNKTHYSNNHNKKNIKIFREFRDENIDLSNKKNNIIKIERENVLTD